ncbi:hypothetical protein [Arthrobacter sp. H5]|uniref:hypothetical protein n=1 Tax=Arthrobacter sp. H5 TaxID=1267973 RepID=UPI0004AFC72E|nr:hypothetical protein [Arthrobacter sp. H5]
MLRVRPIVFTPNIDEFAALFAALGLDLANDDDGWLVFDAGSGRVALHVAEAPSVELGLEVGDVHEFVRRTVEAGTAAEALDTNDGRTAHVQGSGGMVFTAHLGQRGISNAGADPALAVMPLWYVTDAAAGVKVFTDMGARKRLSSDSGNWTDFTAKNGGLLAVHAAGETGIELAFEYNGNVEAVQQRLRQAGIWAVLIDENCGRSLRLPNPDGKDIWVNERQQDLYGYTEHSAG